MSMETTIGIILGVLIFFQFIATIIVLNKVEKIERSYVKEIKVYRHRTEIEITIKECERMGWIVKEVKVIKDDQISPIVEITFVK